MTFKRKEPLPGQHQTSVPELIRRWGGTIGFLVAVIGAIKEIPIMIDASHEFLHVLPAIRALNTSVDSIKEGKTEYQIVQRALLEKSVRWEDYVEGHRDSITHAMPSNVDVRERLKVLERKQHIGLIDSVGPRYGFR